VRCEAFEVFKAQVFGVNFVEKLLVENQGEGYADDGEVVDGLESILSNIFG
jgi:hypothetical protein